MRHRYPFDALHWLRHERALERAAALRESARRAAEARHDHVCAEAARKRSELAIEQLSDAEQAQLERGQLCASDLQIAGDWQKAARLELRAKAEREQEARAVSVTQAELELEARRALGSASSEAELIDVHRNSFRAAEAAAEERAQEEAALEQWSASRFPPRRS